MKKASKRLKRLLTGGALPLLALGSCITDKEIYPRSGEGEAEVTFSIMLPGKSAPASRAMTEGQENEVATMDILAFEPNGNYVYTARCSGSDITTDGGNIRKKTFTVKLRRGDFDLVLLANARDLTGASFEGKSKPAALALIEVGGLINGKWPADGTRPIPMWGEKDNVTIDEATDLTGSNGISLARMLARVDVLITGEAVGKFQLSSVHVYNYNTRGSIAPAASNWNPGGPDLEANPPKATAPNAPASSTLTKGPLEYNNGSGRSEINTIANKCEREIYLFEAENHTGAGHTAGKDHLDRTCIVVGGVYDANGNGNFTDDGPATYYRADFSIGTGDAETFLDVLRDHHYTFTVTKVNGPGYTTSEDAFQGAKPIDFTVSVTNWGAETHFPLGLDIRPSANCYIVAPGKTIGIPIFGQVQQAMDAGDLPATWITNDMDLKAYLVWCDNSDVNGVVATSKLKVYKSSSPAGTIMSVATGDKTGNAVVAVYQDKNGNGVYNAGTDEIKWSWHIWVTDYDPDKQINGTTHTYAGNAFTNPSGIYYNGGTPKRMMDRNLGATWTAADGADIGATMTTTSPAPTAEKTAKTYGLLYQWGRKDPFTSATATGVEPTLYNGSGTVSITSTPTPVASNFINTVRNPMTFYYNGGSSNDWYTTDGTQNNNLWCENGATPTAGSKTTYDPCPPGWRVPIGGTDPAKNPWAGFANGNASSTAYVQGIGSGQPAIFPWYTNGAVSTTVTNATNGRYYNNTAWYPASGCRPAGNGALFYVGTRGFSWHAATTGIHGYYFYFFSTDVNPAFNPPRANGFPVRCVQE